MISESETTLESPRPLDADPTLEKDPALDEDRTLGGGATADALPERPSESASPEPIGRFRLQRLLGQGGMGQVWEAWDPHLERSVAIKRLLTTNLAARRRFVREARLQATIQHPAICPVFEVGQHGGEPYLVMPCLDGVSLDQAVDEAPLEYKLELLRQVAEAVHAAHERGLIHRDLKPANILVETPPGEAPRPVVLDFGIARSMEGKGLTASGEIVGTPAFMAPEQVRGRGAQLDRRTDVYALGATLYGLLVGRPPHPGDGTPLLIGIVQDEPERLPSGEVPGEVEAIVFKCLEKDKSARYDSARALAEDLGRYLAGEPVLARPVTRWIRLGKWMRRHRVAVRVTAATAVVALAALTWGSWSTWRSEERREVARRFGAQVEEIEALARYSRLVPLHDVREDQKQLRERLDAIRPSLDDRDPVVRALAAHAMGRGHLALDELEEARGFLEMAYELDPDNTEIAGDLGRTLSELYRDQLTDLERFGDQAKREEVGRELAARLAGTFGKAGELRKQSEVSLGAPALDLLRRGSSRSAEDSIELDALILFHDGRFEEALELLAQAPPAPPWMYERWRLEGDIRRSWAVTLFGEGRLEDGTSRHQLEEARLAYAHALHVAPSHAALLLDDAQAASLLVQMNLVSLEEHESLITEARRRLESSRLAEPESLAAWIWAIRIEALAAINAAERAEDPTFHLESALELALQATELDVTSSGLWYEVGRIHEQLARRQRESGEDPVLHYEQARNALNRVAETDRGYAYLTSLGLLRMEIATYRNSQGLPAEAYYEAAIEAYRSAAKLHSKPFAALSNLGVALLKSADLKGIDKSAMLGRSLETFEQANILKPRSMLPVYYSGTIRQELAYESTQDAWLLDHGLIEQSIRDFERAIELEPDRFEPRVGLAGVIRLRAYDAFIRGNDTTQLLADAREAHRKALEMAPEQPVALLEAAQTEYLAGRLALRQGLDPTTAALQSKSLCQRSLEARYRAYALLCMGDALSLRAELMLEIEENARASGFIKEAERFFELALNQDEDNFETLESFAYLLVLEARRLRTTGEDPTGTLHRLETLFDRALATSKSSVNLRLIEASYHLERIRWLTANDQDVEAPLMAGRDLVAAILELTPRSPEARRLGHYFSEITGKDPDPLP